MRGYLHLEPRAAASTSVVNRRRHTPTGPGDEVHRTIDRYEKPIIPRCAGTRLFVMVEPGPERALGHRPQRNTMTDTTARTASASGDAFDYAGAQHAGFGHAEDRGPFDTSEPLARLQHPALGADALVLPAAQDAAGWGSAPSLEAELAEVIAAGEQCRVWVDECVETADRLWTRAALKSAETVCLEAHIDALYAAMAAHIETSTGIESGAPSLLGVFAESANIELESQREALTVATRQFLDARDTMDLLAAEAVALEAKAEALQYYVDIRDEVYAGDAYADDVSTDASEDGDIAVEDPLPISIVGMRRTDAVCTILEREGDVLSPKEIAARLAQAGRDNDTAALVSAALQQLRRKGSVVRTGRASYRRA
jgi:hypothetical protein